METPHAVVLFDGVCNFCNASVRFIARRDARGYFHFAPLESDAGQQLLSEWGLNGTAIDSVVLVEGGRASVKSTAALRIARRLSGLWPLVVVFLIVPRFLRDAVYDVIARNRYRWFGRSEQCMVPSAELRARFLA